jgi:hypothetical protein
MSMNPVMMGSANSDEIIQRVLASLRAHQSVMRVNPPSAGNLWNEALGYAASISSEHLSIDVLGDSLCFGLQRFSLLQRLPSFEFCLSFQR